MTLENLIQDIFLWNDRIKSMIASVHNDGRKVGNDEGYASGLYEGELAVNAIIEAQNQYSGASHYYGETLEESKNNAIANIPEIVAFYKETGRNAGFLEGTTFRREVEKNFFWNTFQNDGSKNNYRMAFYNWNKNIYNPIYPIKSHNHNNQVFYYFGGESTKVPITLKGTTSQFFSNSSVIAIPLLDVDEAVNFNDTATPTRENYHAFYSCTKLENLTLSGVIAKNLWIAKSPLTKDSILGIEVTYSEIEVGKILQTDYSNFGFRVDSHTTNGSGDVTSIVATPVQSEEQYATYPISRLDEVSVTFNLVKIGENYYWGGVLGALKDYSGSGTKYTLTLGTTNLGKLTDSEQAIATEKGWTIEE